MKTETPEVKYPVLVASWAEVFSDHEQQIKYEGDRLEEQLLKRWPTGTEVLFRSNYRAKALTRGVVVCADSSYGGGRLRVRVSETRRGVRSVPWRNIAD